MGEQKRLWLLRSIALAFFLSSGVIVAALATHRSAAPVVGPYSLTALVSLVLAAAASMVAALIVFSPAARLQYLIDWLMAGALSVQGEPIRGTARAGVILAGIATTSFVVNVWQFQSVNTAPQWDQWDYLRAASEIREMGGTAELWRQLWNGEYAEANRHPLYTMLLSLMPGFHAAKWFSAALGFVTLALVWVTTFRRSGWLVAGVAAGLVATNNVFVQSASLVACEMLLTLFTLLAWVVIERGVLVEGAVHLARHWLVRSIAIGGILGLAYLTKASAFFLLIGFWIWSLCIVGVRRWSWLAGVAFLVVSLPLLTRNVRAYDDPLHSFNNRFLFVDSFDQGLNRPYRGGWIEARDYWQTHTVAEIVNRALLGLIWETYILLRCLGPATLSASQPLVGLVVLLVAGVGAMGDARRLVLAAFAWILPFILFFAWYYPIAAGDRFLAPVVPILLMFAARGSVSLIAVRASQNHHRVERIVICSVALWCGAATLLAIQMG